MKTLFITLSLLFAAVAGTVYAANEKDPQVSEVRKVEAFFFCKGHICSDGVFHAE